MAAESREQQEAAVVVVRQGVVVYQGAMPKSHALPPTSLKM